MHTRSPCEIRALGSLCGLEARGGQLKSRTLMNTNHLAVTQGGLQQMLSEHCPGYVHHFLWLSKSGCGQRLHRIVNQDNIFLWRLLSLTCRPSNPLFCDLSSFLLLKNWKPTLWRNAGSGLKTFIADSLPSLSLRVWSIFSCP